MKPRKGSRGWLERHELTDKAAQVIIDKEAAHRGDKTARLREARLKRMTPHDTEDANRGR